MRIISIGESQRKELTELEKAKAEMAFQRKMVGDSATSRQKQDMKNCLERKK